MKDFQYRAYDAAGVLKEDVITALNADSAKFKLKQAGLIPVNISDAEKSGQGLDKYFKISFKPNSDQIEDLTSRLSLLLKNGIRADRAIEFALKGVKNQKLKKIMEHVHKDIRKGTKFSDALDKYPNIFDSIYISRVRVGEESGKLGQAFSDIAANLKFHRGIAAKTKQAIIYPVIILIVCCLSIIFIFNFIVPRFSVVFEGSQSLPVYTQILLSMSDLFQKYQFIGLPVIVFMGFAIYSSRDRDIVKKTWQALAVKLPLVKKLTFTLENLRFASVLSMLLTSGVVLSDAMDHAVDSVSNFFVKKKLVHIKQQVRRGENLSTALAGVGFLPDMFDGLVEVGEETGNLAQVFKEMEERLKTEYENSIMTLVALIEPVMIIVMGLVVGSIVVGLLLSMVSVNDMAF